jgi:hypothetical protein
MKYAVEHESYVREILEEMETATSVFMANFAHWLVGIVKEQDLSARISKAKVFHLAATSTIPTFIMMGAVGSDLTTSPALDVNALVERRSQAGSNMLQVLARVQAKSREKPNADDQ